MFSAYALINHRALRLQLCGRTYSSNQLREFRLIGEAPKQHAQKAARNLPLEHEKIGEGSPEPAKITAVVPHS